jgi:hypothetical protein
LAEGPGKAGVPASAGLNKYFRPMWPESDVQAQLAEIRGALPLKSGERVRPHSVFVKGGRGCELPGGAELAISTQMEYKYSWPFEKRSPSPVDFPTEK